MKRVVMLLLVAFVGFPSVSDAVRVYKWRDAAGRIHYGDRPPTRGEQVQKKDIRSDVNTIQAPRQTEAVS